MMHHVPFCFILLERDSFVARDLAEGLSAACAGCICRTLRDPSQLFEMEGDLRRTPGLPVIITKLSMDEIAALGIDQMAGRNAWPLVVRLGLDPVARIEARGWISLNAPFTHADLAELVTTLWQRHPVVARRRA